MRRIHSWWALVGLIVLWSLLFASGALLAFAAADGSCAGQTDAATTWCQGWMGLFDIVLLFAVALGWIAGLVVVIAGWVVLRRRRRGRSPQES